MEIKDKREAEYLVANHLSGLENPQVDDLEKKEINDIFPYEHLYRIQVVREDETLWFSNFANYLAVRTGADWLTY